MTDAKPKKSKGKKERKKPPAKTKKTQSRKATAEVLNSSGARKTNFVGFLKERGLWSTFNIFLFDSDHPFFVEKAREYLRRVYAKLHPEMVYWAPESLIPPLGAALAPVFYWVERDVSLSQQLLNEIEKQIIRHRNDILWVFNGVPNFSSDTWLQIGKRTWWMHQPTPGPDDMPLWIRSLSRLYGLKVDPDIAQSLSIAVLYDPVPVLQAFENLALLGIERPLRWTDIEPYLPSEVREYAGSRIFTWLRQKNYEQILTFAAQLKEHEPNLGMVLNQGYEVWRNWVLEDKIQNMDSARARALWGYRISYVHPGQGRPLTLKQFQQWAQIASVLERRQRRGDLDPGPILGQAMFQWLRIIA